MRLASFALVLWFVAVLPAHSQEVSNTDEHDSAQPTTVFDHPDTSRFWLSGQLNVIFQSHPAFPVLYSGDNSLRPGSEHATSRVWTVFTGFRLPLCQ